MLEVTQVIPTVDLSGHILKNPSLGFNRVGGRCHEFFYELASFGVVSYPKLLSLLAEVVSDDRKAKTGTATVTKYLQWRVSSNWEI